MSNQKIVTICAGHNDGKDGGAVSKDGTKEATLAVLVRNALVSYLQKHTDITVRTDGHGTNNAPLSEAVKLVEGSDFSLEVHLNASTNETAYGIECIGLVKDKVVCQKLSTAIATPLKSKLRGDKGYIDQSKSARGRLAFVSAGGVIAECGFISNKQELDNFKASYWLVAKGMYQVICEHLKIKPLP